MKTRNVVRTRDEALDELMGETWALADQMVAARLGVRRWVTPESYRSQEEDVFRDQPDVGKRDPRRPSDRRLLAQAFEKMILSKAEVIAEAATYAAAHFTPRELRRIRRLLQVKSPPEAEGPRAPRYQRADSRNLELLFFVVERIIPFDQLLQKRPGKNGEDVRLLPGHRGPRVSVPWQALADEWNREHLEWSMSSGDVLRGQFYRAAGRPHLNSVCLQTLNQELDEELTKYEAHLAKLQESLSSPSDGEGENLGESVDEETLEREARDWNASPQGKAWREGIKKLKERHSKERDEFPFDGYPRWRSKREEERERKWRDHATRRDLIQDRIRQAVQRRSGSHPMDVPLREWFLPEARGLNIRIPFEGRLWYPEGLFKVSHTVKQQPGHEQPASSPKSRRRPKPAPSAGKPPRTRTSAKSSRSKRGGHKKASHR